MMLKCNWALLWWRVTLVFISFFDKAGGIDGNYGDKVSVRSRIFLLNLEWHRTNFSLTPMCRVTSAQYELIRFAFIEITLKEAQNQSI